MAARQQSVGYSTPRSERSSLSVCDSRARRQPRRDVTQEAEHQSPQDELEGLKQKYSILEGDRRSAVEVAQFTIRQNRETLANLKREQKEVKNDLKKRNTLARDDGSKSNVEKEIVELEKRVHTLRRTHDKLCQHRQRCVGKLATIQDGIKDLERGSRNNLSSPLQKGLRTVENRLDKAIIKRNEAVSIQRTYEQLLVRLGDECSAFNLQIKSMDDVLSAKKSDVAHLTQISLDAQRARELAKQELQKAKEELDHERANRSKELDAQHHQLKAVQEMTRALKERQQAKSESTLASQGAIDICSTDHKEAFHHIQLTAHVEKPRDLCDKFAAQEHAFEDLKLRERKSREQLKSLTQEMEGAKIRLDRAQSADPLTTGSAGQVDKAESSMQIAVTECNSASTNLEKSSQLLIDAKAGLQHLKEMLEDLPKKGPPVPLSDDTLVEVIVQCGDCMERAQKTFLANEKAPIHQDCTNYTGIHQAEHISGTEQFKGDLSREQQPTLEGMLDAAGAVSSVQPELT